MHGPPAYEVATRELESPLAVVDLDAFDANADDVLRRAASVPVRVASKSVRCRYLLQRVLATPGFSGLMCYSLAEALWLCAQGVTDDIVVAYPSVDRAALRRLAGDQRARAAVTIMVDSLAHLDVVDAALGGTHPEIRVCLELDVSWRPVSGLHIGTRRSPVFTVRQAAELARNVVSRTGFRLVGLMAYEGQVAGLPDSDGGLLRRSAVRWIQRRSVAELTRRRAAVVRAVRAVAELEFVNGGGTGSLETTATDGSVTEVAAGSGLIGSALFDRYSRFRPRPAVLFGLPVVHRPTRSIATLFAGGYVASGPAAGTRLPVPHYPPGLRLLAREGAGEVQTPVVGKQARRLRLGDRVWLRHAKAGELAERFTDYHIVTGETVTRTAPTYRGDGVSFG